MNICSKISCLMVLTVTLIGHSSVAAGGGKQPFIIVQSTTSTANSGLYDYLLPLFKESTGIEIKVVAVGTGQAIRNAKNCDGDVLLVHAKSAEEVFVREGYGLKRQNLMFNDFIIVGPPDNPAEIKTGNDITTALQKIADTQSIFTSRGDDSGTHRKELSLWKKTNTDPTQFSGGWYRETGAGMGATLNIAIGMNAYVMTDRATWISFNNKSDAKVLLEGDQSLNNQYGVILVSEQRCPSTRSENGQLFINWLLSSVGQNAIASFNIDNQQLFFPNGGS